MSNAELLAILMGTSGQRGESVLELAGKVLAKAGDISSLTRLTSDELCEIKGIGPAKAVQILAMVELSRRLSVQGAPPRSIRSPEDVRSLLLERLRHEEREHFFTVLLNTKNHCLGIEEVSVGSLNSSIVHPREVFRAAIKRSAAALIIAHNHPSGDCTPSREDMEVTRRLTEAGRLLGIDVLDHVIFGDGVILSFKEKGLM
ncbi:MAG: DNA repair protein RadC [Selenomonadales bacterium]|jgi:DNA repair protein RadC|nr:DNA repair protein RadC [Selenomonadales bacterium]